MNQSTGQIHPYTNPLIMRKITEQFLDKTLPKESWTHQAHLAVAFTIVNQLKEEDVVVAFLRAHIKAYNESVGTENSDQSGYHETLTIFWVKVVHHFLAQFVYQDVETAFDVFVKSVLATAAFPFRFYSKEVLFSVEARKSWVAPNLLPLNELEQIIRREGLISGLVD
jgi:hypothetical protein